MFHQFILKLCGCHIYGDDGLCFQEFIVDSQKWTLPILKFCTPEPASTPLFDPPEHPLESSSIPAGIANVIFFNSCWAMTCATWQISEAEAVSSKLWRDEASKFSAYFHSVFFPPRNLQFKMIQFDFSSHIFGNRWVNKTTHEEVEWLTSRFQWPYFCPCLTTMRSSMRFAGKGLRQFQRHKWRPWVLRCQSWGLCNFHMWSSFCVRMLLTDFKRSWIT